MKTEEEARKCWCPFARVTDDGFGIGVGSVTASNRHWGKKKGKDGKPRILRANSMCIASECMAWRREGTSDVLGYCGLAGKL